MLSKKERFSTQDLNSARDIKGKRINSPLGFFVVYEGGNKKGIMVGKKVFKTAVLRNKYKRLFYNTVKEIPTIKKMSFIFHPKKTFTKEELLKELTSVLQ